MLAVRGSRRRRRWRFEADGAVTADHGGRRGRRVRGDHQGLGRREGVAAVGERRRGRRRRTVRVSGERGGAGGHAPRRRAVTVVGVAGVAVVAGVGVGVVVGFGVVPVAAVVGVGGRQRVVLRRRGVGVEGLDRRRPLGREVVLPESETGRWVSATVGARCCATRERSSNLISLGISSSSYLFLFLQ